MASAENGDIMTFYVEGASATALAVASLQGSELQYEMDEIDTTAIGDTTRTSIPGKVKITGSINGLYVHTDDAHARLITLVEAGSQMEAKYYRSGSIWKSGTAHINNLTLTWTDNEAATFSCSFSFDGGVTTA